MKLQRILVTATLAAACLAPLAAAQQSEKEPVAPNTGRFGDPTAIARKYEGFIYGVIKEKSPNELTLSQTRFGTDQTFKLTKKTKFVQDEKPSSLDKLKVGDRVFVDVNKGKRTGDLIAKKVVSGVDIPSIPTAP